MTEEANGTVMCFAYSFPYVYSDLLADLKATEKFLILEGGNIKKGPLVSKKSLNLAPQQRTLGKLETKEKSG